VISPDVNRVRFAAMTDGALDGEDRMLRVFHRYTRSPSSTPAEMRVQRGD
jgi:hypothetical protein